YGPGGRFAIAKRPAPSVAPVRFSPVATLRTTIAAETTALPSGSRTAPASVAGASACAARSGRTHAAKSRSANTRRSIRDIAEKVRAGPQIPAARAEGATGALNRRYVRTKPLGMLSAHAAHEPLR